MPKGNEPVGRRLIPGDGGTFTIVVSRRFNAPVEAVWDAVTNPRQLVRWFLPIDGDLKEGGGYTLEGNAIGQILRCRKPEEVSLTWVVGDFTSTVTLRMDPDPQGTVLRLQHEPVPPEIIPNAGDVPGLGAVWELALTALGEFLDGDTPPGRAVDRIAEMSPRQMRRYAKQARVSGAAWEEIVSSVT